MRKQCKYPGKVRQPLSVQLTPNGHEALVLGMARTGLGRNDYVEHLLRTAVQSHEIPAREAHEDGIRSATVPA